MAFQGTLGIIAGGGELPVLIAEHCAAQGRRYFVARIAPFADAVLERHPGATHGLGEMGARIAAMKAAGVDAIVLIGQAPRPDLRGFQFDEGGQRMAPALMAAAARGDDAVLRAVLEAHRQEGFEVVGAEAVMPELLASRGAWGSQAPNAAQLLDIEKGALVAAAIGAFDVGQGVVVCDGLVLAVEAQEGTDRMLDRVATLPAAIRGEPQRRRGVLVKRPKPIQDRRVDLPVIGMETLERAAHAGLAGIAVEAGGALVVNRPALIAAADQLGMCLYGFELAETGAP